MQRREKQPRLFQAVVDIFTLPDLRQKVLFTLGILVVFRFLAHVPLPGVDIHAMEQLFDQSQLYGMLDLFAGGAMKRFSVAAMGVYPYITASIIMQLLVPVIPSLQSLSQQGEDGRHKINRITHLITIPLAAIQGYSMITLLGAQSPPIITHMGGLTITSMVLSMVAATIFLVWLGELITERGVGNGISIIIFGGIIAGMPSMLGSAFVAKESPLGLVVFVILGLATLVLIVLFTEAQRRIPVQYAKSTFRSGRMYRQSGSTYIPLRVNTAGMIPLIFAIALMQFPATIATWFMNPVGVDPNFWNSIYTTFNSGNSLPLALAYWIPYFLLVIAFTYFYTMIIFEQMNLPQSLQQQGGFIPGIRPGKTTADYLNRTTKNLTLGGALFLGIVAVMPFLAKEMTGVHALTLSSTALLIAVGVALDTMKQLESQLTMRRYDGFLK
ncbi:MAG: preprotein translocase subunit SecY [Dehalococcoidia bacterium]|nr:preprotein translocase subunit SecY [Dehalococcoidia bacterium]